LSSNFLWAIVDIFVGLLIIINLIAMWFLRNDV
jgi:Na+/alanine symporter